MAGKSSSISIFLYFLIFTGDAPLMVFYISMFLFKIDRNARYNHRALLSLLLVLDHFFV